MSFSILAFQNCSAYRHNGFVNLSSQNSTAGVGAQTPAPAPSPMPSPTPVPAPAPLPVPVPPVVSDTTSHQLYVATTGSDSNIGTQASPLKTILKASQVALPDTTIHVAPGIYKGSFQTQKSGTANGRIIYLSDTKWGAVISPMGTDPTSLTAFDNRGAYVTIDGFEIDGRNSNSTKEWTVGINVGGSDNIVRNCHVHHIYNSSSPNSNGGAGILLDSWYGFNNMQALNNTVHHVGPVGGSNWYHGIYQTATGTIQNNIVYAVAGGGIHLWHDANHINVKNNTVFNNGYGVIVGGGDFVHTTGPADYINVTNNIAYDNIGIGFSEEGQCGSHNTFTTNLAFQNGTNWQLNTSPHTGDLATDPLFVNYQTDGSGDYHLRASSPAIGLGALLP